MNIENFAIYKTFWRRFFAAILDSAVFAPLLWISYGLFGIKGYEYTEWVISILGIVYSVYFVSKYGQTFGKMAMGVIILDKSGSKATLKQAIMRDIIQILCFTPILIYYIKYGTTDVESLADGERIFVVLLLSLYSILEVITMLSNKKRRSIHDFIAGTIVVKQEKEEIVRHRGLILLVLIVFTIINFGFKPHNNKAVEGNKKNEEVATQYK
jgi:uncharacterized RDD family membrane protein YckC